VLAQLIGVTLEVLLHAECGVQSSLRVILVRDGCAEDRENAVAGGLHDIAVVPMRRIHHDFKRRIDDRSRLFGVEILHQLHDPLISANSAVTVLRSPSIVRAASGCAGATRAPHADSGVDGVAPAETALSVSEAPHLPQKLEDGGFSA
jgi:hypothetical protein